MDVLHLDLNKLNVYALYWYVVLSVYLITIFYYFENYIHMWIKLKYLMLFQMVEYY